MVLSNAYLRLYDIIIGKNGYGRLSTPLMNINQSKIVKQYEN